MFVVPEGHSWLFIDFGPSRSFLNNFGNILNEGLLSGDIGVVLDNWRELSSFFNKEVLVGGWLVGVDLN